MGAKSVALVLLATFALLIVPRPAEGAIVGISIPVGSTEGQTYVSMDNAWSVQAPPYPLNTNAGIGYLVNQDPVVPFIYTLHDHTYLSPNVPDPSRATVTFTFDAPTAVSAVTLIQHHNGISQIEGYFGDDINSMTSLGAVFGPDGDVTGSSYFTELQPYTFDFGNTTNFGTVFQFVIRRTTLEDGYALYRSFLYDESGVQIPPALEPPTSGVPEAPTIWLAIAALAVLWLPRRRIVRTPPLRP